MFWGYFNLGGELVNHARFDAYLANQLQGQSWFHDPDDNGDLMKALGDTEYASPLQDDAPWLDANDPATQRFFGCYLVSASGFGDSTRTATVTQSMFDGGTVASVRRATGQFTMKLLLAAADERAMEAGVTWLRNALDRANCAGGCADDELTYFIDVPREYYVFPGAAAGFDGPMPGITPETSPFTMPGPFSTEVASCQTWLWQPTITEGVQVQFSTILNGVTQQESAPIFLQRTNQAVNPSFQADTSWWSGTGLNRVETGGVDDLAYGNIPGVEDVAAHIQTATVAASSVDRALTISLRSDDRTNATITYDGTSVDVALASQWQRFSMLIPAGVSDIVQVDVETTGFGLDVDQVMIERGTQVRPYVDGDTVQPGYTAVWTGSPQRSTSRITYTDPMQTKAIIEPGVTSSAVFSVLQGSLPGGIVSFGEATVPADQWVDAVTRSVLAVTATSGPTLDEVLQINDRDCGVARTYDIVLTTEVPYAFSPAVDVAGGLLSNPVLYDDRGADVIANNVSDPQATSAAEWTAIYGGVVGSASIVAPPVGTGDSPPAWITTCFKMAFSSATPGTGESPAAWAPLAPVTPGEHVTGLVSYAQNAGTVFHPIAAMLRWFDDDGDLVSTSLGTPETPTVLNQWHALRVDVDAPDGAVSVGVGWHATGTESWATNVNPIATAAMVTEGTYTGDYVDGDTPTDEDGRIFEWTDADDAPLSTSYGSIPFNCAMESPTPVVDPDCPPIPAPPRPPVISLVCADDELAAWDRYFVNVPQDTVASTATSVPLLDLTTLDIEVRSVRVRMHPNPFNYEPEAIDPCSFCAEFVISYLPANTVLSMDGRTKKATINVAASGAQQASTLLFGSDGTPITWPELSCGIPYVMTVDIPEGTVDDGAQTPFEVDLSMVRRE